MKKILLLTCLVAVGFAGYSQKKIRVNEGGESIGGGNNNALSVMIYVNDDKLVEKGITKELKKMKGKVSSKKGEIFADDCEHKAMGDNTFDAYAKVMKEGDEAVKVVVAYDLGGAYLSSGQHGDKFKEMQDMLYDFAVEITKESINNDLKDEQKILGKLEKDQENLVKGKEDLEKAIEDYKNKIKQAEEDIEKNKKDQETKKGEIAAQQEVVKGVEEKLKGVN